MCGHVSKKIISENVCKCEFLFYVYSKLKLYLIIKKMTAYSFDWQNN